MSDKRIIKTEVTTEDKAVEKGLRQKKSIILKKNCLWNTPQTFLKLWEEDLLKNMYLYMQVAMI